MLEAIRKRRSIRKYLDRRVEKEKLNELLKAAMFSASAKGRRPWEFIVVTDEEIKKRLAGATPYAAFASHAPVVIAICYDTGRGSRFKEDSSIAAAGIYLEATNQGLGACYIQISDGTEADEGDPEDFVKGLLAVPGHIRVHCLMTVGYPAKALEPHSDLEFDVSKVHHEKY